MVVTFIGSLSILLLTAFTVAAYRHPQQFKRIGFISIIMVCLTYSLIVIWNLSAKSFAEKLLVGRETKFMIDQALENEHLIFHNWIFLLVPIGAIVFIVCLMLLPKMDITQKKGEEYH